MLTDAVKEIKSRINIVDYIQAAGVNLKKSGSGWVGYCPFHTNSNTPAFAVWPSGKWHCFGSCNSGGDVIDFVAKKDHLPFREAVERLAGTLGIRIEKSEEDEELEANRRIIKTILTTASKYYYDMLMSDRGGPGLDFFLGRSIASQTMDEFQLGYAPYSQADLLNYLVARGYKPADIIKTGMAIVKDNKAYDRFYQRVIFPIRNRVSDIVGFGGRDITGVSPAKFMNSPLTAVFDKSKLLFGLNEEEVRKADEAILVEGYLDVLALHQEGYKNAASPMGTAVSEDQVYTLSRMARTIIFAMDGDAAGEKGMLRGLEAAKNKTEEIASFDARGAIIKARRFRVDMKVAALPPGKDPDELVLDKPDEWKHLIEFSKPIIIHLIDSIQGIESMTALQKSEAAGPIVDLIESIPDSVQRDVYKQHLSKVLGVSEKSIAGLIKGAKLPAIKANEKSLETFSLAMAIVYPDIIYEVDHYLVEACVSAFGVEDYDQSEHKEMISIVLAALDQLDIEPAEFVIDKLRSIVPTDLLQSFLTAGSEIPYKDSTAPLYAAIVAMRLKKINASLENIQVFQGEENYEAILKGLLEQRKALDQAKLRKQFDENIRVDFRPLRLADSGVFPPVEKVQSEPGNSGGIQPPKIRPALP